MAEIEERILRKVHPLKAREADLPRIELSGLPHNHQKGKQCRSCRTLRKIAREQKESERARLLSEASEGAVAVTLYSLGQVGKALIEGVFGVGKAIAENPDPVSQGIAIGGGYAAFLWFVAAYPDLAKLFHLDTFAITSPAGQKAAKDLADTINSSLPDIPISAGMGQYGLKIESVIGFLGGLGIVPGANVTGVTWFDSPEERNAWHKLILDKLGSFSALFTFTDLYRPLQ